MFIIIFQWPAGRGCTEWGGHTTHGTERAMSFVLATSEEEAAKQAESIRHKWFSIPNEATFTIIAPGEVAELGFCPD